MSAAPPVVLLALAEGEIGLIVLGSPNQGQRPVLEAGTWRTEQLAAVIEARADTYGERGASWGCGSEAEAARLQQLGPVDVYGTFLGCVHRLPMLPRPLRTGTPPKRPLDPPALCRVWALAVAFKLAPRFLPTPFPPPPKQP